MLGAIFCAFATQTVAFVLIPLAAAVLGLPGAAIGVLVAVLAGLGLATDMLVAVVSDHLGRRAPMLLGAGVGIAAGAILSVASDFAGLLAGAVGVGLSLSLVVGPSLAYVTEACRPSDAARVQGYNGAIQGLSALAGALLVGVGVERLGPRPTAWLISGLMLLAFTAFNGLQETVNRSPLRSVTKVLGGYTSALHLLTTRPQLQLSALVSLIFNSVVFVVGNSFLPVYIVHDLGESAVFAGTLLAARNVGMTISSPFFGYTVRRFGLVPTMIGANSLAVAGVVAISVVTDARLLALPLALQGLGIGFAAATANTLVASATGRRERALGFATNSLVSRAGSLLTPLLFGIILETSGARTVFVAAGAIGLAYLAAMVTRAQLIAGAEKAGWETGA